MSKGQGCEAKGQGSCPWQEAAAAGRVSGWVSEAGAGWILFACGFLAQCQRAEPENEAGEQPPCRVSWEGALDPVSPV